MLQLPPDSFAHASIVNCSMSSPVNNSNASVPSVKIQPAGLTGSQTALIVIGAIISFIFIVFFGYKCWQRRKPVPVEAHEENSLSTLTSTTQ